MAASRYLVLEYHSNGQRGRGVTLGERRSRHASIVQSPDETAALPADRGQLKPLARSRDAHVPHRRGRLAVHRECPIALSVLHLEYARRLPADAQALLVDNEQCISHSGGHVNHTIRNSADLESGRFPGFPLP